MLTCRSRVRLWSGMRQSAGCGCPCGDGRTTLPHKTKVDGLYSQPSGTLPSFGPGVCGLFPEQGMHGACPDRACARVLGQGRLHRPSSGSCRLRWAA